jgi:hypothetical protein
MDYYVVLLNSIYLKRLFCNVMVDLLITIVYYFLLHLNRQPPRKNRLHPLQAIESAVATP